jgi:phosphate starvation-inducible PhoH-like protein
MLKVGKEAAITKRTDTHHLIVSFEDNSLAPILFGPHNNHLRHLEKSLSVDVSSRGHDVAIEGSRRSVQWAHDALILMWEKVLRDNDLTISEIDAAIRFAKGDKTAMKKKDKHADKKNFYDADAGIAEPHAGGKIINPRSPNQSKYIDAMKKHDMVFGIGPAGTGKTFLAVAQAVALFKQGEIERMVFTRPAVEAGEKLGFLPGDLLEKINPYLRPIYDALHDLMPGDIVAKKIQAGDIEIAPLAFMRGRTLKNAFVVLDEAQNTTAMQMKMFLTRMGEGTRMVITGDPTQVDLLPGQQSGLKEAMTILHNVKDVAFVHFNEKDVVRHKLVTKIIEAYNAYEFRGTRHSD